MKEEIMLSAKNYIKHHNKPKQQAGGGFKSKTTNQNKSNKSNYKRRWRNCKFEYFLKTSIRDSNITRLKRAFIEYLNIKNVTNDNLNVFCLHFTHNTYCRKNLINNLKK